MTVAVDVKLPSLAHVSAHSSCTSIRLVISVHVLLCFNLRLGVVPTEPSGLPSPSNSVGSLSLPRMAPCLKGLRIPTMRTLRTPIRQHPRRFLPPMLPLRCRQGVPSLCQRFVTSACKVAYVEIGPREVDYFVCPHFELPEIRLTV